jgi:hypothetical protein
MNIILPHFIFIYGLNFKLKQKFNSNSQFSLKNQVKKLYSQEYVYNCGFMDI